MTESKESRQDNVIHQKVLTAITGAIREEKVPLYLRILKVLFASFLSSAGLAVLFFILFKDQMDRNWQIAGIVWTLYFVGGFGFLFKPQARLMVANVWSPFIIARIFLISTLATLLQISICPSFVFLDSPIGWNPMLPLTNFLMHQGGMSLCMGFCGFLFTMIAGGLGLFSVREVARKLDLKNTGMLLSILLMTQLPVLYLQIASPELNEFALFWLSGMILGLGLVFTVLSLTRERLRR